jgi:hypothetical protein
MHPLALQRPALAAAGAVEGLLPAAAVADIALNALSNEAAMRTLHHGFAGSPRRRFLAANAKGSHLRAISSKVLPGARIHVLGPSRDPEIIKDMDPPVGQSYLRLIDMASGGRRTPPSPFDDDWTISSPDYSLSFSDLVVSEKDAAALRASGEGLDGMVAAALDKAVNGTSLMVVLQIGTLWLLFPGDAQWGTWKLALENTDARELLGRVSFCKLGHHGSHNASPTDFVEHVLRDGAWVMVSTRHVDQWPNIPRRPLMEALGGRTDKLARSDKPAAAPVQWFTSGKGRTTAEIPLA